MQIVFFFREIHIRTKGNHHSFSFCFCLSFVLNKMSRLINLILQNNKLTIVNNGFVFCIVLNVFEIKVLLLNFKTSIQFCAYEIFNIFSVWIIFFAHQNFLNWKNNIACKKSTIFFFLAFSLQTNFGWCSKNLSCGFWQQANTKTYPRQGKDKNT